MTRSAKRLQQRQPSAAENVLNMATAAGIALKAENGRLEAIASRPPSEVMRRLLERHEAAILALLRGQS